MKRTHGCKATDGKRRYRRLGSTRKHDIGIAIANLTKSIAYGVRTACASGNRTRAHAFEAKGNGNLTRRHVRNSRGDVVGGAAIISTGAAAHLLRLRLGNAADTASDNDPRAIGLTGIERQPGIIHRLASGRQGKLREACQMFGLARSKDSCRVPLLDLGSQRNLHVRSIEQRDGGDAALAGADGLPAL